jgi:hypothetical protein
MLKALSKNRLANVGVEPSGAVETSSGDAVVHQRGRVLDVFQKVRLRGVGLVSVRPKYAPLFAYAPRRQHVAGGARQS